MSDTVKIKNCPFVHDKQNMTVIKQGDKYVAFCTICGGSGPIGDTPQESIDKWNDRVTIVIPDSVYKEILDKYTEEEGNAEEEDDGTGE